MKLVCGRIKGHINSFASPVKALQRQSITNDRETGVREPSVFQSHDSQSPLPKSMLPVHPSGDLLAKLFEGILKTHRVVRETDGGESEIPSTAAGMIV